MIIATMPDGGGKWKRTQSLSEPLRAYQRPSEPLRATQSHSEPFRATQSHSEPLGTSEPLRAVQSHSEPIRGHQRQSEPKRVPVSSSTMASELRIENQWIWSSPM